MVSKGQIVGIDWNRIARLHSHVLAHMSKLPELRYLGQVGNACIFVTYLLTGLKN